jgi:hypothetical protein
MCKWGAWVSVRVRIPADLSSTGEARWKDEDIDSCIADLVRALQEGGIDMRGSCCGHGQDLGHIALQDGRVLVVTDTSYYREFIWAWKAVVRAFRLHGRYIWRRAQACITSLRPTA